MTSSLEKPSVGWIQQQLAKCYLAFENDEKSLPLESFFQWKVCDTFFDVVVRYGDCFDVSIDETLGIKDILDEVATQTKDSLKHYSEMINENYSKPKSDGDLNVDETTSQEMVQFIELARSKTNHDYKVREASERFKAILSLGHADVLNKGNVDINYITLGANNTKSMIHDSIPCLVLQVNNSERIYILPVFTVSDVVLKDFIKYALKSAYPHENIDVTEKKS